MRRVSPPLRLRVLGIPELIDQAIELYRARFLVFTGVSLALTIPALATAVLSGSYRSLDPFISVFQASGSTPAINTPPQFNGAMVGLSYLIGIVMAPLAGWSAVPAPALVAVALQTAHGRDIGVGGALAAALKRYWALLLVMIASVAVGLLVFTCLGIPLAVWILVAWAVVVPVMLEERASAGAAFTRSWSLVRDNWWRTFAVVLLVALLGFAVELGLVSLFGFAIVFVPGMSLEVRDMLVVVASAVVGVATRPLLPIALTVMYYELRVRHEALDLDQLAATVAPVPQAG